MDLNSLIPNNLWRGCSLHPNPMLTDRKAIKRERKWARRKMWELEKRFDIAYIEVPSTKIIQADGKIFMHPEMIRKLNEDLTAQEAKGRAENRSMSIGYRVDATDLPGRGKTCVPTYVID